MRFTLITEVDGGIAPPWIDWESPEIHHAELGD
jgi:hypothetical protein